MQNTLDRHPRRALGWLALAATFATLTGCANQQDGAARVSPLHPELLGLPAGSADAAAPAQWWAALNDAQLSRLMQDGLTNSPSLAVAAARIRAAAAAQGLAKSADGPHVDANVSYSRTHYSEFGLFPPPIGGSWMNLNDIGLNAGYSFDFWGKTKSRVEAAIGQQRSAIAEQRDTRNLLEAAIATQYLEWQTAKVAQRLAADNRQQAQDLARLAAAQQQAGLNAPDVRANADSRLADLRQRESQANARVERTEHALAALTGHGPNQLKLTAQPVQQWSLPTGDLSTRLLAQRGDVLASRWRAEAAASQVKAARAEFYPDISLSAMIGLEAQNTSDLFTRAARQMALSPVLTLPIFHAGELNANLAGRAADYDAAVASYNQTLLNAARDATDRLSDLNAAKQAETDAQHAREAEMRRHQSVQARFNNGLVRREVLLQSLQSLNGAQLAESEAHAARIAAQIALIRALGGAADPMPKA
ncbi:efflux transporter outer membrane subunit [Neisseriaceae bacterium JH1-16]|nr:efflux transporter outer membrane subunit [Neisseriaceae bacterium JH1-16]